MKPHPTGLGEAGEAACTVGSPLGLSSEVPVPSLEKVFVLCLGRGGFRV